MPDGMHEFLPEDTDLGPEIFECVIKDTATAADDAIDAEELYGTKHTHRDCVWSPRIDDDGDGGALIRYPERGDVAFVAVADSGRPVIVEWTPYG